jgi:hypothetical protein
MLFAPLAKLLHDEAVGDELLVLAGIVVYVLANGTFQRDHLVL